MRKKLSEALYDPLFTPNPGKSYKQGETELIHNSPYWILLYYKCQVRSLDLQLGGLTLMHKPTAYDLNTARQQK